MEVHGLRFTGHDAQGAVRVAEMDDHPFFPLSLFQPGLAEKIPYPVVRAFAAAAVTRAPAEGVNSPEIP
ncbi:hypothetical protein GCM10009555_009580 [Acrocarpospora macrocephala]|uniref:Uncharacterized protein n=1 Tax=Acrocarpospora macrocephala TaxID=150177 RepID=A0A5M3WT61_9ACTN|nr:hypothetical protein [Acrocarpospora macrocephala]GES10491.1 hypothetical protein Amac_040880 [Acrocarpospora macrocephala]